MSAQSHRSAPGASLLQFAALFAVLISTTGRLSAADDVASLVDEGLNRIVADEVTERMAKFLESYNVSGLASVSIKGSFRSLSSDDLKREMTDSLDRRGIAIDGSSNVRLEGEVVVTQTKETVIVVMQCSLTDGTRGEMCTVRVRKLLPVASNQ